MQYKECLPEYFYWQNPLSFLTEAVTFEPQMTKQPHAMHEPVYSLDGNAFRF